MDGRVVGADGSGAPAPATSVSARKSTGKATGGVKKPPAKKASTTNPSKKRKVDTMSEDTNGNESVNHGLPTVPKEEMEEQRDATIGEDEGSGEN